jgi:hypothetical protein
MIELIIAILIITLIYLIMKRYNNVLISPSSEDMKNVDYQPDTINI